MGAGRLYATVKIGAQTKLIPLEATIQPDGDTAILKVDTELELDAGKIYISNLKVGSVDQTKTNVRFLKVLDDGSLVVISTPIDLYEIADVDDSGDIKYYGFTDISGGWYILEEDTSVSPNTYRYIKGDTDYPANFIVRGTLGYDYFYNIF